MHIQELVLENFKSFGRKTRIPLYEDFTTISGPNGSGKSNIIDAVLFALGLARTRGIRARKLTDLIYNPGHEAGADAAGPMEATVEVILDNEDGRLSRAQVVNAAGTEKVGDVDKISIRRRVKETEDNYYSYYYLNDRSVNLSDIQDLLAQAGVTPEGYNVVMQGDVTGIINMTAGERREIIDEIAGVAEFDAKKEDALEELEVVQERIDEAELRIEEKEDRLEQLADERETALEYRDLREEKTEYEGYLKAAELEEKREERESIQAEIEDGEAELEELESELDQRQGRVTRLQEDLEDLNAEIERKGEDEQMELKREVDAIQNQIARLEDKIELAEERIDEAEARRKDAFVKLDRKNEEIDELERQIRETKVEQSSVKSELEEREEALAEVEERIDAVDTEFEALKDELQTAKEEREERRGEKNELQREQDRLLDQARRRSSEIDEAEAEREDLEAKLPELEAERDDLESELRKAEANRENIAEVVDDLQEEKRDQQEELDALDDEIQAKQQEYAQLEAQAGESGDSSYGRAVSTILNAEKPGVHGTVAQLGSVEDRYATACETAAGGRLANVVVNDDGVGEDCIDYLKAQNAGRATFLPLTEMDKRGLPSAPDDPGVVDFAYNLVDFGGEYEGIFSYVLGDTLVVEDMETARAYMGRFRMVTLEGDLVEKSGAMTGGSTSGSRYSFTKTGKGKLERVAEEINGLQDRRSNLKSEIRDLEERIDSARDRRSDATEEVQSLQADVDRVEDEMADVREEIEAQTERVADLEDQREAVDEEMNELEESLEEVDSEIATLDDEIEEIESELADSEVPELTAEAEEIEGEIADLEDRMDALEARRNEYELEKGYAEDAIDDLNDEIEQAQETKADQQDEIAEFEDEIEAQEATLEETRKEILALEEELSDLKEERTELRDTVQEAVDARDEVKSDLQGARTELNEHRERASTLDSEIEELEAEVDAYDPEEVPDHDEVRRRIGELESEMATLEPVNMKAIDEYDAVEADLEDLQERKDTLVDEREGITDRIESYESQKKSAFMESFEAIDDHFQRIFERLSNGTGELVLEDEEDPFDGGMTMKAEPADKPVARLEAMSGGEKSLTALSFIFAIQRHDPAPFYALDEIDAFLDAANAERVGEMVDELAGDAQFVVVSHRSAMLERSERAIGVTMQDDNVSAVTGIDLGGEGVPADD